MLAKHSTSRPIWRIFSAWYTLKLTHYETWMCFVYYSRLVVFNWSVDIIEYLTYNNRSWCLDIQRILTYPWVCLSTNENLNNLSWSGSFIRFNSRMIWRTFNIWWILIHVDMIILKCTFFSWGSSDRSFNLNVRTIWRLGVSYTFKISEM